MSDQVPIEFDSLAPIEVPATIAGKQYLLREASEDAACKYRNAAMRAARFNDRGKVSSIEGVADVEPLLVSLCLFELTGDGKCHLGHTVPGERPVPIDELRRWPAKRVKTLFERIKDISDLGEKKEDEESSKNGQGAGAITSA